MQPPYFYSFAVFLHICLLLCGLRCSDGKQHDLDKSVHGETYRSRRDNAAMLKACPEKQTEIVRGFTYSFKPVVGNDDINYAFSQAVSYGEAVQQRILKRKDKYFDLAGFPDSYNISFPPQIMYSCYETAKTAQGENIGSPSVDLEHIYKRPITGYLQTQLANPYFAQRDKMYSQIALYTKFNHDNLPYIQIKNSCQVSNFTKITDLIHGFFINSTFDMLIINAHNNVELYAIYKVFISDTIIYEIARQACTAVGHSHPRVTQADWDLVKAKFIEADAVKGDILHRQLFIDALNFNLSTSDTSGLTLVGKFHNGLSDMLTEKYYPNVFRVHLYPLIYEAYAAVCQQDDNRKCITRKDAVVIVKCKTINLDKDYVLNVPPPSVPEPEAPPPGSNGISRGSEAYIKPRLAAAFASINTASTPLEELTSSDKLAKINLAAATADKAAKVTVGVGSTLKQLITAVHTIAKYAGPLVATVTTAIAVFEGNHLAKVLTEMNAKFAEMHQRFDKLERQMHLIKDDIINAVKKESALQTSYTAYQRDVTGQISRLRVGFQAYQNSNNGPTFLMPNATTFLRPLKTLVELCKSEVNPYNLVSLMHEIFVNKAEFRRNILHWSQTDRFDLQTFLIYRVQEVADLLMYTTQCSTHRYSYLRQVAESWTAEELFHELSSVEAGMALAFEQLHDIRYAIVKMENDQLYGWQNSMRLHLRNTHNSVAKIQDAAKNIAADLKKNYGWNDFFVTVFKTYWPNSTIPGMNENIFYERFVIDPDCSDWHVVQGNPDDAKQQWGAYIIVNWGINGAEKSAPNVSSIKITLGTSEMCSKKGIEYPKYVTAQAGLKSLFTWRTFVGYAWHTDGCPYEKYKHISGQHADIEDCLFVHNSRIRSEANSCCTSNGELHVGSDGVQCWHKHQDYNMGYFHKDHAIRIIALGNFGEGY